MRKKISRLSHHRKKPLAIKEISLLLDEEGREKDITLSF